LVSVAPRVQEVLSQNPHLRQPLVAALSTLELEGNSQLLTVSLNEGWFLVVLVERHVALLDLLRNHDAGRQYS